MTSPYASWVSRMAKSQEGIPVRPNEIVQVPAGKPMQPVEFARTDRPKYVGEVGKRNEDYIYHFFLSQEIDNFESKLAEAFFETFKLEERLQASFSPELNSWAVKASGFAANPLADTMALRVFDVLDKKLE